MCYLMNKFLFLSSTEGLRLLFWNINGHFTQDLIMGGFPSYVCAQSEGLPEHIRDTASPVSQIPYFPSPHFSTRLS